MINALEYFKQGSGIVTLCGSTKFFFEAMQANKILTFNNWMVLACGSWGHSFDKYAAVNDEHDYSVVKRLHFHKIQMSDCIVVVSDDSRYIGSSTIAEINFARYLGKGVFRFDGKDFTCNYEMQNQPIPKYIRNDDIIDKFELLNGNLGY